MDDTPIDPETLAEKDGEGASGNPADDRETKVVEPDETKPAKPNTTKNKNKK